MNNCHKDKDNKSNNNLIKQKLLNLEKTIVHFIIIENYYY